MSELICKKSITKEEWHNFISRVYDGDYSDYELFEPLKDNEPDYQTLQATNERYEKALREIGELYMSRKRIL